VFALYHVVGGDCCCFFFLNQQFITRRAVADRGSDYVATYMQSKLTWNYKKGNEKEMKREKERKQIISREMS